MEHHHHHHPDTETDWAAMAELLDLDAEILDTYLSEVTAWLRELAGGTRRILDLGSGTGTGTLALLRRFTDAEATAVDKNAPLLERLMEKARGLGVAGRVRTVQADLDAAWPDLGAADLVWASASLHHLTDPGRVLADVFAAIRPGGLLAVTEMDSLPRFLPDDGLETRGRAAVAEGIAGELPYLGSDWGALLTKAGFAVEAERLFTIELTPPLPASTGRYAQLTLRLLRSGLDGRMSAGDLAALDDLTGDGPGSVLHRDDLTIRAERTVWAARRP